MILHRRLVKDRIAYYLMLAGAGLSIALVPLIALALAGRASTLLDQQSLGKLMFSVTWSPLKGEFGFLPFVVGTFWVTGLAMVIAVPLCMLSAIYIAEYAPNRLRASVKPLIDLLAGIPSVVYGLWGILTIVPFLRDYLIPRLSGLTRIGLLNAENPTGYSVLSGGIVLAVMVFPVIISTLDEVFTAVPHGIREASLALGASRWQTIKGVVLRRASPGIIAAIVFGFSRAIGETMAVMMVVGNVAQIPRSIFDAGYPLPALIANNYGEMMSIPMYDAALMTAALVLLLVVFLFTLGARLILMQAMRSV
ncbi:MAG: phosphate ABC transporter permease subunit PstC [Anaerolineales bacterium]|nr:phosphate ABC transporter permease subunit PstC [Anaerolineales bacterium]